MNLYIYTYIYIRHRACANGVSRVCCFCLCFVFPHYFYIFRLFNFHTFLVFYLSTFLLSYFPTFLLFYFVYCRHVYCRYVGSGIVCVKGAPHFSAVVTTCVHFWCHILTLCFGCIWVHFFQMLATFWNPCSHRFPLFWQHFLEHRFRIDFQPIWERI